MCKLNNLAYVRAAIRAANEGRIDDCRSILERLRDAMESEKQAETTAAMIWRERES